MQAEFSTKFRIYPHIFTIFVHVVDYQVDMLRPLNEKFVDKRDHFFAGDFTNIQRRESGILNHNKKTNIASIRHNESHVNPGCNMEPGWPESWC